MSCRSSHREIVTVKCPVSGRVYKVAMCRICRRQLVYRNGSYRHTQDLILPFDLVRNS